MRWGLFVSDRNLRYDMGIPVVSLADRIFRCGGAMGEQEVAGPPWDHPPPVRGTWWAWHPKLPHESEQKSRRSGGCGEGRYRRRGGTWMALGGPQCWQTQAGSGRSNGAVPGWRMAAGTDIDTVKGPAPGSIISARRVVSDVPVTGDWG